MKFTRKMLATSMIAAAGAVCTCAGAQRDGRSRPSGGARTGAERAGSAVPPAARDQSGRRDAAHAGPHLDARQRPGYRRPGRGPRARCRPAPPRRCTPAPAPTGRNGVGHSAAACGSGRRPGRCDRAGHRGAESAPLGEMNIPNMPFLPVPLPHRFRSPADLAALMPSGLLPGCQACCGARGARRGSGCGSGRSGSRCRRSGRSGAWRGPARRW